MSLVETGQAKLAVGVSLLEALGLAQGILAPEQTAEIQMGTRLFLIGEAINATVFLTYLFNRLTNVAEEVRGN